MRIVLLAVDDEFAGEMQRPLYGGHPGWVVGSVISSCAIYKRSRLGGMWFVLQKSGFGFLAEMIHMKLLRSQLDRRRHIFPSRLSKDHGVEQFVTADINSPQSVAKLRSWKPDIIISTNFSHYIGKTVRESIANYGVWNLHKSFLPRYRGMAPSFHALLEGASSVGATLHLVAKGFDSGDILTQVEIPVTGADSVYSLNRNTSIAGGKLLLNFLENYQPGVTKAVPQPTGAWKEYTYPTPSEVRAFRTKGLYFYRPEQAGSK